MTAGLVLLALFLAGPAFLAWHAWVAGNAENDDGSGW